MTVAEATVYTEERLERRFIQREAGGRQGLRWVCREFQKEGLYQPRSQAPLWKLASLLRPEYLRVRGARGIRFILLLKIRNSFAIISFPKSHINHSTVYPITLPGLNLVQTTQCKDQWRRGKILSSHESEFSLLVWLSESVCCCSSHYGMFSHWELKKHGSRSQYTPKWKQGEVDPNALWHPAPSWWPEHAVLQCWSSRAHRGMSEEPWVVDWHSFHNSGVCTTLHSTGVLLLLALSSHFL